MTDNRKITLRLREEQIKKWDSFCNHEDDLDDDADEGFRELVKENPTLYRNRSRLIRDSVNTNLYNETSEQADEIEKLDRRVSSIEDSIEELSELVSDISRSVKYIEDNLTADTTELQTEIYQLVPVLDSSMKPDPIREYEDISEVFALTDIPAQPNGDLADEYGRIKDIIEHLSQSETKIRNAIDQLVTSVDNVVRTEFKVNDVYEEFLLVVE